MTTTVATQPRRVQAQLILLFAAGVASLAACGSSRTVPPLPLEPIAFDDTLPITRPGDREANEIKRLLIESVGGELGHGFSLRRWLNKGHEAVNRTRFDDVVPSSWFQHRVGRGNLTPGDVARGPTTVGPDTSRQLTVIAGKAAGISPGFTLRDARGDRYIVKFDPKGNLHLASAAGVVANRLFYAAGYNTPEDYIVVFDSARLVLDPEAQVEERGVERPMTEDDVKDILYMTDALPDGRYLALASKFVPGRPIGPFYFSGVRGDDPNDYYHHQHRRELRGLYVVSSWLNHVDMRFANTMDVFIDPPGFVRHYLIDFAASLGSGTIRSHNPREGSEYNFALWPSMGRILTLGFYKQGWEDDEFQQYHSSIGWFQSETFDPGRWRANWPNAAFRLVTPADGYWGAKLVAGFSDEHIRAAVREGELPVQQAENILVELLAVRRDKIIAHWYAKVMPLEAPDARMLGSEPSVLELGFDDLGLEVGLWEPGQTRYRWEFEDAYLGIKTSGEQDAAAGSRQALTIPLAGLNTSAPAVGRSQMTATLKVEAWRGGEALGRAAAVLLRWDGASHGYSVVGLQH